MNDPNEKPPWGSFVKLIAAILSIVFGIMVFIVIWDIITETSHLGERFVWFMERLFRDAEIFPPNAEFIQLMLITVFVGWAASRFKRMINRSK